jgi:5-formyltetrahydrofolate cyclo-ligase
MSDSTASDMTAKAELRRRAKLVRKLTQAELGTSAATALQAIFLAKIPWRDHAVIGGYWPMAEEMDIRSLLNTLAVEGRAVGLPVVTDRHDPLTFRRWLPGMEMVPGPHGTHHPPAASPVLYPSLLLMPLLAFDRSGRRLGYGGGYFDRTLSALRARGPLLAVGVAFSAQEVDTVPEEAHDQRLDWIVTELGALEART